MVSFQINFVLPNFQILMFSVLRYSQRYQSDYLSSYRYFDLKMSNLFFKVFTFINEKILRNSKESTILKGGVITILWATILHDIRNAFGCSLKLQYPNETLKFPLPNRWSNPNKDYSKQQLYMVIKQVSLNLKPAGLKERAEIDEEHDRAKSAISVMNFFNTIHLGQIQNVRKITKEFDLLSDVVYIPQRQLLFADSMVNGEVSYMLRKYGVNYYELPESKAIDEGYRTAFEQALQNQVWNDNARQFGLSKEEVIRRVSQNDGVYTMLYEHMEKVSKGDVIDKLPEIYVDNLKVEEIHYLHVPYPIFLRVKTPKNTDGYICIGIGFRIKQQVKIFSPFFANQGERVWRLAQSHLAQIAINDFSVRVHLGIYHFTTNQYHVPIYKFLSSLSNKREKHNFHNFLHHTYTLFSRGLEGVNVAATASLVHPIEKFSLVNKALNVRQDDAIKIIAQTSNNVEIYDFNPASILRKQGISEEEVHKYFEKMSFDLQLYEILSEYIEGVFKCFHVEELSEKLLVQINQQAKHMGVGEGSIPRPPLRNKEDVLKTIKNLCFCWVGFHSHTFSVISLATYALLRPSMLKKAIPNKPEEWEHVEVGQELPDSKVMMQTGKLNEATTQRDSDNFLMDNIQRQAQAGAYLANKYRNDKQLHEAYKNLQQVASKTLKRLQIYEEKILAKNRARRENGESFTFEWMIPSQIQTSLNI